MGASPQPSGGPFWALQGFDPGLASVRDVLRRLAPSTDRKGKSLRGQAGQSSVKKLRALFAALCTVRDHVALAGSPGGGPAAAPPAGDAPGTIAGTGAPATGTAAGAGAPATGTPAGAGAPAAGTTAELSSSQRAAEAAAARAAGVVVLLASGGAERWQGVNLSGRAPTLPLQPPCHPMDITPEDLIKHNVLWKSNLLVAGAQHEIAGGRGGATL
jgi:hypothetical protein